MQPFCRACVFLLVVDRRSSNVLLLHLSREGISNFLCPIHRTDKHHWGAFTHCQAQLPTPWFICLPITCSKAVSVRFFVEGRNRNRSQPCKYSTVLSSTRFTRASKPLSVPCTKNILDCAKAKETKREKERERRVRRKINRAKNWR